MIRLLSRAISFVVITILITFISCRGGTTNPKEQEKTTIMIFSAASLTDVLTEIIDSFELKYPVKVQTNLASSGTLARQIVQGGSPDVYISASKKWANYVDSIGGFIPGTKTEFAKNELVLIAPINSTQTISTIDSSLNIISMLGKNRLSMGDPLHVPAGKYAKQALNYFGWYKKIETKILPAKDVRSALMVVEMGESPLGIVYKTDALKSKKVIILSYFPENSHKPIVYVGGITKDTQAAKQFLSFIKGEETVAIWEKHGFKK